MLFNSYEFGLFLVAVFFLYWFVFNRNLKVQNLFLVGVSYLFYGWWDWRFLSLIIGSSLLDFLLAKKIESTQTRRKKRLLLTTSLFINLGVLGFFKYYNFFADNLYSLFSNIGIQLDSFTLEIILPVGISFYTFQTLSYTIDVFRGKMKPTSDIISFFAFVSFFPQLVAGPIERATNLLPQFYHKRNFNSEKAIDGLRQILWGLVKKVVIADNAAIYANDIFDNFGDYSSGTLVLGTVLFTFQIYGDFSGYSDIAIGTARLFGFDLKKNFAFPYFSRDIAEYWRRWHISLSTWFRDYLYIPLGGSNGSMIKVIFNVFIIFIVSGFWHGAKWTYVVWGAVNAAFFIPLLIAKKHRKNTEPVSTKYLFPSIKNALSILLTFALTCTLFIIFRADSLEHASNYLQRMFTIAPEKSSFEIPYYIIELIIAFVIIEWIQRHKNHGLELNSDSKKWLRWAAYYTLIVLVIYFSGNQQTFIYFQF